MSDKKQLSPDQIIICNNLHNYRVQNTNLKQHEVAEKLNYNKQYYSAVERGVRPASEGLLKRFSEYFQISLDVLYKGTSMDISLDSQKKLVLLLLDEVSPGGIDLVMGTLEHVWTYEHEGANYDNRVKELREYQRQMAVNNANLITENE